MSIQIQNISNSSTSGMVQKVELLPELGFPIRSELVVAMFENLVTNHSDLDCYSVKVYNYLLYTMIALNKFSFNHTDYHLSTVLGINRKVIMKCKARLIENGLINCVTDTRGTSYSIVVCSVPHTLPTDFGSVPHTPTSVRHTPNGVPDTLLDENGSVRHTPPTPLKDALTKIGSVRHTPTSVPHTLPTDFGSVRHTHNYSSSSIIYTSTKRENSNTEVENSKSQNGAVTTIEYLKSDEFVKILLETIPKENEARALIHSFYTKNRNRTYSEPSKIIEHFWNWLDKMQANEKQYQIIVQGYQNKTKSEAGIKWENVKVGLLKSGISNDVVKLLKLKKFENNELVIETLNPVVEYLESETVINIFKQLIRSNYGKCKVSYSIRKSQ